MERFLGVGHREVLDGLRGRLESLVSGDVEVPRIVVLEGVSGVGKSRIVREFYRELRADRQDPYWPGLAETGDGAHVSRDPLPGRKRVGPPTESFVWPAGAVPRFGWWQLYCERMQDGSLIDVIGQAREELTAHLVPLAVAWSEHATLSDKAAKHREAFVERVKEVLNEGGVEAASVVLGSVGVAIPGLGMALSWLARGARGAKDRLELKRTIAGEFDAGEQVVGERVSAAEQAADLIRSVAGPEVPAVVVVEDVHLMPESLGLLLDRLGRRDAARPVLTIAMAWPEAHDDSEYIRWRDQAVARGDVEIWHMPDLEEAALLEIIAEFAPNTPHADAVAAARYRTNPLVLEAILASPAVARSIARNGGALTAEAIAALPTNVRQIYRDRFAELDKEVQDALAATAGAMPEHDEGTVWPFIRDIVAEAARSSGDDLGDVIAGVQHAGRAWIVSTGVADSFREAIQAGIAKEHFDYLLLPAERVPLRAEVVNILAEWIDARREGTWLPDTDHALIVSRWLLALDASAAVDGSVGDRSRLRLALITAARYVATKNADAYQYTAAIDTLAPQLRGTAPSAVDDGDDGALAARGLLVGWLGDAGRVEKAATDTQALLNDQLRVLGPDHPDTLTTRHNLAYWLGQAGQVKEAATRLPRAARRPAASSGTRSPRHPLHPPQPRVPDWRGRAGGGGDHRLPGAARRSAAGPGTGPP